MAKNSNSKKIEEKLSRITFDAPEKLKMAFHSKVVSEGRKLRDVLCELMENYINNNKKVPK
jgi:hypothetical protein